MISLADQLAVVTGGSRALLPPHSWHVRPGTIELLVDTPVETQGLDKRDAEELSARVRARICEISPDGPEETRPARPRAKRNGGKPIGVQTRRNASNRAG